VTAHQWGAEYLLLGGSHALLPAPIHRLDQPLLDFRNPTDAYYRCLDGEWDVDGDGLYAEWEDDAAEMTVHLTVGRIPADTAQEVTQVVNKIIAFEARPAETADAALFVASLMDPDWTTLDPYPNWSLNMASGRRDFALLERPELRTSTLFQDDLANPPSEDALNPRSLADSLSSRPHDLVYLQLHGAAEGWELVGYLQAVPDDFSPLANCGHSFIAAMISGGVADTREECVLSRLITMEDGGAVAAVAPTGLGFLMHHNQFQDDLWRRMLNGEVERLGQAFTLALEDFVAWAIPPTGHKASTYWVLSLQGDPATLLRPTANPVGHVPHLTRLDLRAVPNPFNPTTTIQFTLDQAADVQLEIFDLHGRRVTTLIDREMGPGPQSIPWNDAPASGLYFARITTGATTRTIKLMMIE
jgi:hypothetical protein